MDLKLVPKNYQTILKTDVLVVGGGSAGLRAALAASAKGADVTIVVKGRKFGSGSSFYPLTNTLGYQACSPDLSQQCTEEHYRDILEAAQGMCDPILAEILVREAYENIKFLEHINAGIYRVIPRQGEGKPCFSRKIRTFRLKSLGFCAKVFCSEIEKRDIKLLDRIYIYSLLVYAGECFGAAGISEKGELVTIYAGAVILACGGGAGVYHHNLCSRELIGDGYALALDAGATLFNMEFMQFIYGISYPKKFLFHQGAFARRAKVFNSTGEKFIKNRLPVDRDYNVIVAERALHGPFTSRLDSKYFDLAFFREIEAGNGSPNLAMYCSLAGLKDVKNDHRLQAWLKLIRGKGIDFKKETLQISLHAHAFNGGIHTDENTETNVRGLFAAGEVATGSHGADRLGGNMMISTLVFGKKAGENAATRADKHIHRDIKEHLVRHIADKLYIAGKMGCKTNQNVRTKLPLLMWENAGICRTEPGLTSTLNAIDAMEEYSNGNPGDNDPLNLWENIEIWHMLKTCRLIVAAALMRKESRGSHYRDDYPQKDDDRFSKPIFIKMQNGVYKHEFIDLSWGSF